MKLRKSTFVRLRLNDGSRIGSRFSRDSAQVLRTGANCALVTSFSETYVYNNCVFGRLPEPSWSLIGHASRRSHSGQTKLADIGGAQELVQITDEVVYQDLQMNDIAVGRWAGEDPSLRAVQRWLRARPQTG